MGDLTRTFMEGITIHPRRGYGFWTDGKLFDFDSAYPHGVNRLVGAELSFNFSQVEKGKKKAKPRRIGELVFLYYFGRAKDHVNQNDLPLAEDDPLLDIVQFDSTRKSKGHLFFTEWRWPSFPSLFRFSRWTFIQPFFSLGMGGYYKRTQVDQYRADRITVQDYGAVATASTHIRLVEVHNHVWEASLETSVRMLAGQSFGIFGEFGLRFTWRP